MYFVSPALRRGITSRSDRRRAPNGGRGVLEPDVGDDDAARVRSDPARRRARPSARGRSRSDRPRRRRPRSRRSRRRRRRERRPRRPGAAASFIRPISSAASGRGSPWKPVPKSASTTTSYPSRSSVSSATCPASRSTRAATRPSPPFEPPPQTHAKLRAAGNASIASRATAAPARSISSGIVSG